MISSSFSRFACSGDLDDVHADGSFCEEIFTDAWKFGGDPAAVHRLHRRNRRFLRDGDYEFCRAELQIQKTGNIRPAFCDHIKAGDAEIGNTLRHIFWYVNRPDEQDLDLRIYRLCDKLTGTGHIDMDAGIVHQIIDRLCYTTLIWNRQTYFSHT